MIYKFPSPRDIISIENRHARGYYSLRARINKMWQDYLFEKCGYHFTIKKIDTKILTNETIQNLGFSEQSVSKIKSSVDSFIYQLTLCKKIKEAGVTEYREVHFCSHRDDKEVSPNAIGKSVYVVPMRLLDIAFYNNGHCYYDQTNIDTFSIITSKIATGNVIFMDEPTINHRDTKFQNYASYEIIKNIVNEASLGTITFEEKDGKYFYNDENTGVKVSLFGYPTDLLAWFEKAHSYNYMWRIAWFHKYRIFFFILSIALLILKIPDKIVEYIRNILKIIFNK
jgi:hypothetical protein